MRMRARGSRRSTSEGRRNVGFVLRFTLVSSAVAAALAAPTPTSAHTIPVASAKERATEVADEAARALLQRHPGAAVRELRVTCHRRNAHAIRCSTLLDASDRRGAFNQYGSVRLFVARHTERRFRMAFSFSDALYYAAPTSPVPAGQ